VPLYYVGGLASRTILVFPLPFVLVVVVGVASAQLIRELLVDLLLEQVHISVEVLNGPALSEAGANPMHILVHIGVNGADDSKLSLFRIHAPIIAHAPAHASTKHNKLARRKCLPPMDLWPRRRRLSHVKLTEPLPGIVYTERVLGTPVPSGAPIHTSTLCTPMNKVPLKNSKKF